MEEHDQMVTGQESREPDFHDVFGVADQVGAVLAKAMSDSWTYVVGLKSGAVFQFEFAELSGDWLVLHGVSPLSISVSDFYWGRPVDVRLSEIAWAAEQDS